MLKSWLVFFDSGPGDYLKTFLVCSIVAIIINVVESQQIFSWITFFCSYCYGFCTHFSISLAQRFFHSTSLVTRYILPSLFGFIAGSLIIVVVSGLFLTGFSEETLGWLLVALIAHSMTTFWLVRVEQDSKIKEELKQVQLEKVEQEKALIESQLCLLQSQMEPHFLFNTIANVRAAIQINPQKAIEMLDHLSVLLRQSLYRSKQQELSLKDEISFCESYLAIQKIRLGERLNYVLSVDPTVNQELKFPSKLIQPLVENAILHGLEPLTTVGHLNITIEIVDKKCLRVCVQDNGVGLGNSTHQGNGIGLNNIKQRLEHYYFGNASLEVKSNELGGVTAELMAPLSNKGVGHI